MTFNAPAVCSMGGSTYITGKISIDPDAIDNYIGCPISSRTPISMSPGSFERSCKSFQARVEANQKTDGKFQLAKPNQFCKRCKIGKAVLDGKVITVLPAHMNINIVEFDLGDRAPSVVVIQKNGRGRKRVSKAKKPWFMTKEIADQIRQDRKEGMLLVKLAEKYNLSMSRIKDIVYDKAWT